MGEYDAVTWQAVGLTLSLLGLALSVLVWRRRGAASGLRAVAWSLIPLAAAATGVLRLGWEVTDAVLDWAVRLVFSPVVWAGVALAGVSMVLFVVSGFLARRAPQRSGRAGAATPGVSTGVERPAARPPAGGKPAAGQPADDDDMADIEAILKKHGIG